MLAPSTESAIKAFEIGMLQGTKFTLEESLAVGLLLRRISSDSWRGRLARKLIGFHLDRPRRLDA